MTVMQQFDDSSLAFVNANDSGKDFHIGGPAPTALGSRRITERVLVRKLTASDSAGGVLAVNFGEAVIVTRVVLHVKTAASAACTVDVGVAANATTSNDSLVDGLDVHTAAGLFDSIVDHGTDGKSRQLVSASQFLTASMASGATAGLVGYAYVHYYPQF